MAYKLLSLVLFTWILSSRAGFCEDLDNRMVTCGNRCCPRDEEGSLQLTGSSVLKDYGIDILTQILGNLGDAAGVPSTPGVSAQLKQRQEALATQCCGSASCRFTAKSCLPKHNPAVTPSSGLVNPKPLTDFAQEYKTWLANCIPCGASSGRYYHINEVPVLIFGEDCGTSKGAQCPLFCAVSPDKGFSNAVTCGCDGKWVLTGKVSDYKPTCDSYCNNNFNQCQSSVSGAVGGHPVTATCSKTVSGSQCRFTCKTNGQSFLSYCACGGVWSSFSSVSDTCQDCPTTKCSGSPSWFDKDTNREIAKGTCSSVNAGDSCSIQCVAGGSFVADCRCSGFWAGGARICPVPAATSSDEEPVRSQASAVVNWQHDLLSALVWVCLALNLYLSF